ncbi:MAG: asparagine synthase (glutamine-hydrolyzing) [bacterium]|nr:asparagine synthase (glutamine-hydrolyzing) [bacterium]
MCGIFGIYNFSQPELEVEFSDLKLMGDAIAHRGPDDEGFYLKKNLGFGSRRLSIIDRRCGHQPIANEDQTIRVVYNGEIYNYLELRQSLEQKGHRFSTSSDTEVLVHLYEDYGELMPTYLRGMFAFALWDSRSQKLLLARDRVGIKPLFYTITRAGIIFGSELKCLLKIRGIRQEVDLEALDAYLTLSYIPAPLTIFSGIHKLLPGHLMIIRPQGVELKSYWTLVIEPDYTKTESYFLEESMRLLEESVRIHLMSEVPLGAFLSGGIDSGCVVALMAKNLSSPVQTFTIGFSAAGGGFDDERPYARLVAKQYGACHYEEEVSPQAVDLLHRVVQTLDEPLADDSVIPSYTVSEMAKRQVTVILSGLGGDELFAGYERYLGFHLADWYDHLPRWTRQRVIHPLVMSLPERSDGSLAINHLKRFVRGSHLSASSRYLEFISLLPTWQRYQLYHPDIRPKIDPFRIEKQLESCFIRPTNISSLNRVFYQDIHTYLPDDILALTDRISMAHSLEVRVPFLDHKLLEFCFRIPAEMKLKFFQKKYLLKKCAANLLPQAVLRHKKQGFVGPLAHWLRHDLRPYICELLSQERLRQLGFFDPRAVQMILDEHFSRRQTHDKLIFALLLFQIWHMEYR